MANLTRCEELACSLHCAEVLILVQYRQKWTSIKEQTNTKAR